MVLLALKVIVSQIVTLEPTNPHSLFQLNYSLPQTGQSPSGRERGWPHLTGGQITNAYSIQCGLLKYSWFCLSEKRQIQIFSF